MVVFMFCIKRERWRGSVSPLLISKVLNFFLLNANSCKIFFKNKTAMVVNVYARTLRQPLLSLIESDWDLSEN